MGYVLASGVQTKLTLSKLVHFEGGRLTHGLRHVLGDCNVLLAGDGTMQDLRVLFILTGCAVVKSVLVWTGLLELDKGLQTL